MARPLRCSPSSSLALGCSLLLSACVSDGLGISPGGRDGAATGDLSLSPTADAGPPDLVFVPAPHPPLPQLANHGGMLLSAPAIVTITFTGDPLEGPIAAFDKWLPQSTYFTQGLAEYGIKAGTQEAVYPVAKSLPPVIDDSDVQALLKSLIQGKMVPAVTANRLYTVYVPDGTLVTKTFGMMSYTTCKDLLAYHAIGPTVTGGAIIYVVVPRCHDMNSTDLDFATWNASGEIAKTVTDPTYAGWYLDGTDVRAPFGADATSLCQSFLVNVEGHAVVPIYSSAAARGEMRPCVPAPPGPMFGVTPKPDTLTIKSGSTASTTLTIYTTAPLAKPLRFFTYAFPMLITATAAQMQVQNGDQVRLDVTVDKALQPGTPSMVFLRLDSGDYHWTDYLPITVQ